MINKIDGYIVERNGTKYLKLFPTGKSKNKYKKLWSKIRYLSRSIVHTSSHDDEKCIKIKFNSNENLPPKGKLEFQNVIIVVRFFA